MTTEATLINYFEEAHGALVMAAKVAHLEKHPEAENISRLIDVLEDQITKFENNKYEVVAELCPNTHIVRVIEAVDERHARRIMWEQHMTDSQRDNCADLEVFTLDEVI
jgi:hypothetical protein